MTEEITEKEPLGVLIKGHVKGVDIVTQVGSVVTTELGYLCVLDEAGFVPWGECRECLKNGPEDEETCSYPPGGLYTKITVESSDE